METKIRYRVYKRKRSNRHWRSFRKLFVNRHSKWVVMALAFVIGATFNSQIKGYAPKADSISVGGVPEPSTVSLTVCGAAFIFIIYQKKLKK